MTSTKHNIRSTLMLHRLIYLHLLTVIPLSNHSPGSPQRRWDIQWLPCLHLSSSSHPHPPHHHLTEHTHFCHLQHVGWLHWVHCVCGNIQWWWRWSSCVSYSHHTWGRWGVTSSSFRSSLWYLTHLSLLFLCQSQVLLLEYQWRYSKEQIPSWCHGNHPLCLMASSHSTP